MKKILSQHAGFNVWFQPAKGEYAEIIGEIDDSDSWSVPAQSSDGDLLLFYLAAPNSCVFDLFVANGPVKRIDKAAWKGGKPDDMAAIRRVCTLEEPLCWEEMKLDDRLKNSHFIKMQMQGRYLASDYWHVLLEIIVSHNPDLAWLQDQYGPRRIGT
jgi:hypothetical protein